MPSRPTGVSDVANATGVVEIDVVERSSPDLTTTLTADPGAAGTTVAVSSAANFPTSGNFKIRVASEVMLVTAGQGTLSWTVTRGIDNTTAAAHAIGSVVAFVVGVQRVEPVDASRIVSYKGRVNTFRTPGRAGTAGQKIISLHNATGSLVKVRVNKLWLDCLNAAAAGVAPTVLPPVCRLWKVTVLPTNGTALTKTPMDSAVGTSSASVTALGDASADGTNSATALTSTLPAGTYVSQEFAPRIMVVGTSASTFYEPFDREVFLDDPSDYITLNALEGVVLYLDYTALTANPTTTHWVAGLEWEEYTLA